ncbi:MAG: hypothetical protein JW929_08165 [Anaerolineales bacterium]|nr:hypothetical protein [Anaerolineales bacterium]
MMAAADKNFLRKATPAERFFRWSPYSIVSMAVRIRGEVAESMLGNAVRRLQARHPILRARVQEDSDHIPWFISEGAGEIPVEFFLRKTDGDWMTVHRAACGIPFEFGARPLIRFLLVRSPGISEVIILCHHMICDGISLAYLARDLMLHLGDPERPPDPLPDPVPVGPENLPQGLSLNPIVRFFIRRFNKRWESERVLFDQEDYAEIHRAYWEWINPRMLTVELSEDRTAALAGRCRTEGVTVTSALSAAFAGAQIRIRGVRPFQDNIHVAASVRGRLRKPVGEGMGFYAGMVAPKFRYNVKAGFWDNARKFHRAFRPLLTDKNLCENFLTWDALDPGILEALHFKKLGALVPPSRPRHPKLSAFSRRGDIVASIQRREKMEALDRLILGTAVTNLSRMEFPRRYGGLELDRLILHPGGAFPISNVNLVVGAVTCSGKLSLALEYAEQRVDTASVEKIRDAALEWLTEG